MHIPSAQYQCNTGFIPVRYPVETEAFSEMERGQGDGNQARLEERLRRGCGGEERELGLQSRERGGRRGRSTGERGQGRGAVLVQPKQGLSLLKFIPKAMRP